MPGLIVLALLAGFLGLVFASQATIGVGLVGFGCLLAILARIRQADVHHRELHPEARYDPTTDPRYDPTTGRIRQPSTAPDNSAGVALPSKLQIACGFLITAAAIGAGLFFAH